MAAVYFASFVLLAIIQLPLYLRAGLRRDFGSAFSMAFLKDFLKRTWGPLLLSQIFLHVTGVVVVLAGFMLCIVGMYPAAALVMMATHHIDYQLYELYLQRGGEPILPREARPAAEKSF
jgi:hypothetical protein